MTRTVEWGPGLTQTELEDAQERYGVRFPPDLADLFQERQLLDSYEWSKEDERIRKMLAWPAESLLFDVEQGFWWPDWGERPEIAAQRAEVVTAALARVPRLIPLLSHRFIPETPYESGNPVFSMHGFDTIYYGSNLDEYFANEANGTHLIGPTRTIAFWSEIVDGFDKAYAYYAALPATRSAAEAMQEALRKNS